MRKVTSKSVSLLMEGKAGRIDNTFCDGKTLYLFDNPIAEWREDGLYITHAGFPTRTTLERLNGIPNVSINTRKGQHYLNGEPWHGDWTRVLEQTPPEVHKGAVKHWDTTIRWVSSDGWRGSYVPKYAVLAANDTGMYSDSPCRSEIAMREIGQAMFALTKSGIPTKVLTCETSNVFLIKHFIITRPCDYTKAREMADALTDDTKLLYRV